MVAKGSLLSFVVVVVVVIRKQFGCGITLAQVQQWWRGEISQPGVR